VISAAPVNVVLTVAAALVLAATLAGCQSNASAARERAVYAEYSDDTKPMAIGWNTRIFNRREAQTGSTISLEDRTGVIALQPGTYHITGNSVVAPFDGKNAAVMPMANPAYGGYARLRYLADTGAFNEGNDKAVAIGTVSNTNALPSLIDTYLRVDKEAKLVLEHQVGNDAKAVKGIYLHVNGNGSAWHIASRITIERLRP
jgi:hypothetical protein